MAMHYANSPIYVLFFQLELKPICEQLDLFKGRRKQTTETSSTRDHVQTLPSDDVLWALREACSNAVFFTTIPKVDADKTDTTSVSEERDRVPQLLTSFYNETCLTMEYQLLRAHCPQIWNICCRNLTSEQILNLQKSTEKQSVSPLRFKHTKGRITSTKVHDVICRTDRRNVENLVTVITGCKTYDLAKVAAV